MTMMKNLTDNDYSGFISGGTCVIGFTSDSLDAADMTNILSEFEGKNALVDVATMNIDKTSTPKTLGVTAAVVPIIVIFKNGKPFKVIQKNDFSVEKITKAIGGGTANITLQ
jgi:thioredoxin-like negative regulator of GroEL